MNDLHLWFVLSFGKYKEFFYYFCRYSLKIKEIFH